MTAESATFCFGDTVFRADFTSARRPDGEEILFTRLESKMLKHLAANPDRVLTRGQLLDAISGSGSDRVDRSIDFVIARLRRKLGDSPRHPSFIATRYGEGYVWVAREAADGPALRGARIVIGPCSGVVSGSRRQLRDRLVDALRRGLARRAGCDVAVDLGWFGRQQHDAATPAFAVEVILLPEGGTLDCVFVARDAATGRSFGSIREPVGGPAPFEAARRAGTGVAERLVTMFWRGKARAMAEDAPLMLAAHVSAAALAGEDRCWQELRLQSSATFRADGPDDPVAKLLRAAAIAAGIVARGPPGFATAAHPWVREMHWIDTLMARALPAVRDDPVLAGNAAELLHFADETACEKALDLAEDAHARSAAPTATLPPLARLRAFSGRLPAALEAVDLTLSLARHGSALERHALVTRCKVLLAAGRHAELDATARRLRARCPADWPLLALMILGDTSAKPSGPDAPARHRLPSRATLRYARFVLARAFRDARHRDAVMAPTIRGLSALHGGQALDL